MILFLDDLRMPEDIGLKRENCLIVRNLDDAIAAFKRSIGKNEEKFELISLDHDLGDKHYSDDFSDEKTGYEFILFLEEKAANGKLEYLPEIRLHTANPVGRARMSRALDRVRYFYDRYSTE